MQIYVLDRRAQDSWSEQFDERNFALRAHRPGGYRLESRRHRGLHPKRLPQKKQKQQLLWLNPWSKPQLPPLPKARGAVGEGSPHSQGKAEPLASLQQPRLLQ